MMQPYGEGLVKHIGLVALAAVLIGVPGTHDRAAAQDTFPSKTLRLIVPVAPGSATDTVARVLANKLTKNTGQSVVVENVPGGGLNIGAAQVARAAPDGHTLLVAPPPPVTVNHLLYRDMQYQPKDFVPITMLVEVPNVLIVKNDLPVTKLQEFIAYAKANPVKLSFGSQGLGATSYLTTRLFESRTGVSMTHVPYRGEVPALNDIVGNQIDMFFATISTSLSLYKAGKLKYLAMGSKERSRVVPDIPTIAESGLPGFQSTAWYSLVAPPGTPAPLVQTINRVVLAAMRDEEVVRSLQQVLLEPISGSPEEAKRFIDSETELWSKVVKDAGIPMQ
jgi:tripartite-type tricarboxylate transporter receptor subunit TctC